MELQWTECYSKKAEKISDATFEKCVGKFFGLLGMAFGPFEFHLAPPYLV